MRQNIQLELAFPPIVKGEARSVVGRGTETRSAATDPESPAALGPTMETILDRENLKKALSRVKGNKGAPGVDGMSVEQLPAFLKEHWPAIRDQLLKGAYRPQPVRRVEIRNRAAVSASSVFRRYSTALSSRRCCRSCRWTGTRRSPSTASASGRTARPIRRCRARKSILPRAIAGSWTSTWRSSSIESITTC